MCANHLPKIISKYLPNSCQSFTLKILPKSPPYNPPKIHATLTRFESMSHAPNPCHYHAKSIPQIHAQMNPRMLGGIMARVARNHAGLQVGNVLSNRVGNHGCNRVGFMPSIDQEAMPNYGSGVCQIGGMMHGVASKHFCSQVAFCFTCVKQMNTTLQASPYNRQNRYPNSNSFPRNPTPKAGRPVFMRQWLSLIMTNSHALQV